MSSKRQRTVELGELRAAKKVKKSKFRINGKKLFLTYSQCDLDKERVLTWFHNNFPIKDYIIAQEMHKDGGRHLHVYISTEGKFNITNARRCDIDGFHPNMEGVKSASAVQRYCKKEGDFITNLKFGIEARARDIAKRGDIVGALQVIMEELPSEIKFMRQWTEGFKIVATIFGNAQGGNKYTLDQFIVPRGVSEWNRRETTLILMGPSNIGKTQLAKALFKNALLCRHIDKLKQFDRFQHDGIIFDDMSFNHWPRESVISLLDLEEDSDINVKCSMVTIPAGTPRIITTNRRCWVPYYPDWRERTEVLEPLFPCNHKALKRRVSEVEVTKVIPNEGAGAAMLEPQQKVVPTGQDILGDISMLEATYESQLPMEIVPTIEVSGVGL